MDLGEPLRRFGRWYVGGIREVLHRKALKLRTETLAYQVQLRREGADLADQAGLEVYLAKRSATALAWADFLDALAGRARGRES